MSVSLKPNISADFIRGLMVSYAASNLYQLQGLVRIGISFPLHFHWMGSLFSVFSILIFAALLYLLVFTPTGFAGYATVLFVVSLITNVLSIFVIVPIFFPDQGSPFGANMLFSLTLQGIMIWLSLKHERLFKNKT